MQRLPRQLFKQPFSSSLLGSSGLLTTGKTSGMMMMNKNLVNTQRFFSSSLLSRNDVSTTTMTTTTTTTSAAVGGVPPMTTGVSSEAASAAATNMNTTTTSTLNTIDATATQKKVFDEPLHGQQSFDLDDFEDDVAGQQLEAAESMSEIFSSITDYLNPSKLLEACIVALHDAGLPWWGSIATVGFALRLLMSPLNVISMRSSTIMSKLGTSLTNLKKDQVDPKKSPTEREHAKKTYEEITKKEGFKMSHMFLPILQSPIFIAFFFCINRMVREIEGLQWGGMLWFNDLTVKDPTYILPIISASCFMAVFLVNTFLRSSGSGRIQSLIAVGMGIFSFALVPFTGRLPAALFMYWVPSNIFQILFYLLMSRKPIKAFFKIPEVDPTKGSKGAMGKAEKVLDKFFPSKTKTPSITQSKLLTKQALDQSKRKI